MLKKLTVFTSSLFLVFFMFTFPVSAQTDSLRITTSNTNYRTLQNITPSDYLRTALNVLFGLAGVASFIFLLIGGVGWITAGGDKEATDRAKKTLTRALVGLAIVFSLYAVLYVIRAVFNIDAIGIPLTRLGASASLPGGTSGGSSGYICSGSECQSVIPTGGRCPCGGFNIGLCTTNGTLASTGFYGACYQCTNGLWVSTGGTGCAPITCGPCN
jgi:hypothetical protein